MGWPLGVTMHPSPLRLATEALAPARDVGRQLADGLAGQVEVHHRRPSMTDTSSEPLKTSPWMSYTRAAFSYWVRPRPV